MNICLTSFCNNHCPYCFQEDFQQKPIEEWDMKDIPKFFEWGNFPILKVLGGEPTLYSKFNDFIDLLKEQSQIKEVCFITNMLGPPSAYEKISELQQYDIQVGLLINSTYDDDKEVIFKKNLTYITQNGEKIYKTLGVTLMPNPELNIKYLTRIIQYFKEPKYKISSFRLGFMTPKPSDKLLTIYNYNKELTYLYDLIKQNNLENTIEVNFDCPINFCQVSQDMIDLLTTLGCFNSNIPVECEAGAPIDVWPNHQVVYCSSSTGDFTKYRMEDFKNHQECSATLLRLNDKYKIKNTRCTNCALYKSNACHPCHSFDQALLRGEGIDA